jgi:excisionase family DNA binding protein
MAREVTGPGLLLPEEFAALFRVNRKTVIRWAKAGKIRSVRTPGINGHGHLRLFREDADKLLRGEEL